MRSLVFLVCTLGACDLQPAKQREKSAVAVAPAAAVEPPTPPPVEPPPSRIPPNAGTVDAGVRPTTIQATEECTAVAAHITNLVKAAVDAQQEDRGRMIRRIADTCTKNKWTEATRTCFLAGKTSEEVDVCGRNLKAPDPE